MPSWTSQEQRSMAIVPRPRPTITEFEVRTDLAFWPLLVEMPLDMLLGLGRYRDSSYTVYSYALHNPAFGVSGQILFVLQYTSSNGVWGPIGLLRHTTVALWITRATSRMNLVSF